MNANKNGPSRYMMSVSSASTAMNKNKIITQFEFKQNPTQSNIVRCLMNGIKATKRTCLECEQYSNTIYESQRSISLPLISNETTYKIRLLTEKEQVVFYTNDVMPYSSINVLKYHIQQYIFKERSFKIGLENIKIGQIVAPKYASSTEQFIRFLKPNYKCSDLNSTAFAICKSDANKPQDRNILVLSMVYERDDLYYHYHTVSISD
eukprot:410018_1